MRPINEINDPAKLLAFAKSKRLLQFSSHESLGEITSLLYKIVMFADKNMPIRAYLDVVREMQGSMRQVDNLVALQKKELEIAATADGDKKRSSLAALTQAKGLIENIRLPYQSRIDNILNSVFKEYPELAASLQAVISSQRPLAFEDEFVLVVSFLDLEVSKLGAITYLKGESPDYKETKRNRSLLDTRDEGVLKALSAGLTRPNDQRGSVEMGMILSSQNRLSKLIRLHEVMPEVIRLLSSGKTKLDVLREIRVGGDKLTLTDYDIVSRMARREKLVTFRNRQKDPANSYELRGDNHLRVKAMAEKWGVTPRRALNKILDDFLAITEKHIQFGPSASTKLPAQTKD